MKTRIKTLINLDRKLGRVNIVDFGDLYLSNLHYVTEQHMKDAVAHQIDGIVSVKCMKAYKTKSQVIVEFKMTRHPKRGAMVEDLVKIAVADF